MGRPGLLREQEEGRDQTDQSSDDAEQASNQYEAAGEEVRHQVE